MFSAERELMKRERSKRFKEKQNKEEEKDEGSAPFVIKELVRVAAKRRRDQRDNQL